MFKKILFATDGSEAADKALPFIISLAKKFDPQIFVLYCVPHSILKLTSAASFTPVAVESSFDLPRGTMIPPSFKIAREEKEKAGNIVGRTQEVLKNSAIASTIMIGKGNPGKVICESASRQKIDLVIIGQKGGGKIKNYALGSTSYYVSRHAPCSVLIIK